MEATGDMTSTATPAGGAADTNATATPTQGEGNAQQTATPTDGAADKPYLGAPADGAADGGDKPAGDADAQKGAAAPTPDPLSDEAYDKALVKDTVLLGEDKNLVIDHDLAKSVMPTARELGVSPEAFNRLANAMAKAQVDKAREELRGRIEYFEKMKQQSLRTYTQRDFEQINAGIDRWFKPGGIMNSVIRNSELGADPEFLALMHHLGAASRTDSGAGAADGGGGSGANPNGIDGLARMW